MGEGLVGLRSCELPIAITRDGLFPFYSDSSFQRIQRYNKLPAFNVRFPSSCKIQNLLPVDQNASWLTPEEDHGTGGNWVDQVTEPPVIQ